MATPGELQRAVASAVLIDNRGCLLLQQRDHRPELPYAGWWTLFGGAVEVGETPDAAIRRELYEELRLHAAVRYWFSYRCPARSVAGLVETINHIFIAQVASEIVTQPLYEGHSMAFFTPQAALGMRLAYAQEIVIERWVAEGCVLHPRTP
ncbi:MAG: NUDIX domain-containing protein [Aggregatilineales bacterium]